MSYHATVTDKADDTSEYKAKEFSTHGRSGK